MPGFTTGSTGSLAPFHRARPTGQSARRYFARAFARLVGRVLFATTFVVVLLSVTWPNWAWSCSVLAANLDEPIAPRCAPGLGIGTEGVLAVRPEVPPYEHLGLLLFEFVTWSPVTAALSIATLVTVLLYCRPERNRLSLGRTA